MRGLTRRLTSLLACVGLSSCGLFTREVQVPVTPTPCSIPTFHVQADCKRDLPCLIGEFALTLQAEHAVAAALSACPQVRQNG